MLDHIILTVSDIERSLAFYEAALKPLNIKFFMPYKGKDGHPDLWGFGDGKKAFFWIKQGKPDPTAIHWGFASGWPGPCSAERQEVGPAGNGPPYTLRKSGNWAVPASARSPAGLGWGATSVRRILGDSSQK